MEYICLYLCLIFLKMSNTQQHSNEEATCDLVLFEGFFFLCKQLPCRKTKKTYLNVAARKRMMNCSYVVNDGKNKLCCTLLITFVLSLCTGETTVLHRCKANRGGIPSQKEKRLFRMGGQAIFLYSPFNSFS